MNSKCLKESHSSSAIRDRLQTGPQLTYLKDFVYGAVDGVITTFAIVAGVAGAGLPSAVGVTVILGVSNLLADGFSMAVGNFLATRAEQQHRDSTRKAEEMHIALVPEGEREEIRQIFAAKGFQGDDLERVVDVITSDGKRWVDTMLQEEHGLALAGPSPLWAAAATFVAFVLVGALPLLAFFLGLVVSSIRPHSFLISSVVTSATFFGIGIAKSRFVNKSWLSSGMETFVIGTAAAGLAYTVGVLLRNLVMAEGVA